MADEVNRVFLWGTPRGMTTALVKCLSYADGIQVVNQPYASVHSHGPHSELPEPNSGDQLVSKIRADSSRVIENCKTLGTVWLDHSKMSFTWIRDELLQAPYPDKRVLLCKDQAHYLHGKYDMLPGGFKYSFMIRHPIKVFCSYKKILTDTWGDFPDMRALPPILFPPGCGFKELYDLVQYVKENIDPQPVIVDADDLLEDPAGILSTYCARMGIPYSDKLLSWEPGSDIASTWLMADTVLASDRIREFYKRAFESVKFDEPTPVPDVASCPEDVQACVKFSHEYYENLYRDRIRVSVP